jgi:hypothetical protein
LQRKKNRRDQEQVEYMDKVELSGEGKSHAEISGQGKMGPELDPEMAVHELPGDGIVAEADEAAGVVEIPDAGPTGPEADGVIVMEMDGNWRGWEAPARGPNTQ